MAGLEGIRTGAESRTAGLDLRVLGPLEAWRGSDELALGGRKQRAVLAILLVDPTRLVPVDDLIDGLWGSDPPKRAVGTLQAYISNLRRVLEPDRPPGAPATVLVSRRHGYGLDVPQHAIDALRFESLAADGRRLLSAGDVERAEDVLARAVATWRGHAFADFRYDQFAQERIASLQARRIDAMEDLFDARIGMGRASEVVPSLEALVLEEPLRERLRSQLMIALYRSGRQGDALRTYDDVRRALSDELGVLPSPELQRLHERIVRHDSELDVRPSVRLAISPDAPQRGRRRDVGEAFVGRQLEHSTLRRLFEQLDRGRGGVGIIEGEAGIGKTRLAEELAAHPPVDVLVLWAHNEEDDAVRPYSAWSELIRPLEAALTDLAISESTRRLLALAEAQPQHGFHDRTVDTDEVVPEHVADELADAFDRASRARPLVVVFEDVHWAPKPSLDVLTTLARRTTVSRIALIITTRSIDTATAPDVVDALGTISRLPIVERVRLSGLVTDEIANLVEASTGVTPSAAVADAIRARTDGNPFFISQLIAVLSAQRRLHPDDAQAVASTAVPGGVRDVVRRRIDALPDDTRSLVASASVAGREFDLDVACAATGLDGDRALEAAEAAVISGVITGAADGGGRYTFSHALVRESILEDLGPVRRARLHARLADVLLERHGDEGDHVVEVAWHMWRSAPATPRGAMLPYLARAGELARARADFDTAEALLSRAAQTIDALPATETTQEIELRVRYQLALVRARLYGTRSQSARESIDRVEELGVRLNRPAEVAHALWYTFSDEIVRGDTQRAAEIARTMLIQAERSGDATALAFACSSSGLAAIDGGRFDDARHHLTNGVRHWRKSYPDPSAIDYRDSLYDPQAYRPDVMCLAYEAVAAWLSGDDARSVEALNDAFAESPAGVGGRAYPRGLVMYCRTWLDTLRRDAGSALSDGEAAVAFARTHGLRFVSSAGAIFTGWAIALERDPAAGVAMIEDGLAEGSGAIGSMRRPLYLCLYAEAVARAGQPARAREIVAEAVAFAYRTDSNRYIIPEAYRLDASFALELDAGAVDAATEALEEGLGEARRQRSVQLARRLAAALDVLGTSARS